jgi:Flp pilus assembly protein TadG
MTEQRSIIHDDGGAAVVEFAILSPLLIAMLAGILAFGEYFWMSHTVQQAANDAARAAVAGLDAPERSSLVDASVAVSVANSGFMQGSRTHTSVVDSPNTITVTLSYDSSDMPIWALNRLVPMPQSTIARTASVRMGGY